MFLFANALRMTTKYEYHLSGKSECLERKESWKRGEQEMSNMGSFKLPWGISTITERTGCSMTLTLGLMDPSPRNQPGPCLIILRGLE